MTGMQFSFTGLLYLVMLFVPNILWASRRPAGYEQHTAKESPFLLCCERAGQALVCCLALVAAPNGRTAAPVWRLWLAVSFLLMLLYECWWLRYFRSPRTMMDFYSSLLGIPVAGASLPVMAFLLLGVYRKSPLLAASSALLGIGHIGIHLQHRRGITENPPQK